jgi:hypothetical protein
MQIGVGLTYWPWATLGEQVELARRLKPGDSLTAPSRH